MQSLNKREKEEETLTLGNLVFAGRVAVTVAVVPLFAVGLHGRVARVLGKTWLQAGDLALAGRAWNRRSLAACAAGLGAQVGEKLTANGGERPILAWRRRGSEVALGYCWRTQWKGRWRLCVGIGRLGKRLG